jgi:glycosyltransferase involved in cell wall biosynthesis
MQRDGIAIDFINYRSGPLALLKARRLLRLLQPDIVQGWMYYGCALASLLARVAGSWLDALSAIHKRKVIWSIRHNPLAFRDEPLRLRVAMQLLRLAKPDRIIYNSASGQHSHDFLGYNAQPHEVIPNGVDTNRFRPDETVRSSVRQRHQVMQEAQLIGLIGRFHPAKGVADFLQLIAPLRSRTTRVLRFVLVGPAMTEDNPALITSIDRAGLTRSDVLMIGPIQDLSQFMPALDLLVSASVTEALPNVVLEAMACAVPVVATRVGDVPDVLGDADRLVTPSNVDELVMAVANLVEADPEARRATGLRDRERVIERYAIEHCLRRYDQTYRALA